MNFGKIFSMLSDSNIDKEEVFRLVDVIKNMDLSDEENLRKVIRQASVVAKKPIDKNLEDELVRRIQKDGLTPSLLDLF